jgi:integrase
LRASELRGLRWSDVDLDAEIIHVRQRADAWRSLGPPKSKAGSRDIPLVPTVVNALKGWKPSCPASKLDLVFPTAKGGVQTIQNVYRLFWYPIRKKCELPNCGFHSLRHVAASLFIAHLGWTPKRTQEVMGHASISMTFDTYGHMFKDKATDKEAMKKLEAVIAAA